ATNQTRGRWRTAREPGATAAAALAGRGWWRLPFHPAFLSLSPAVAVFGLRSYVQDLSECSPQAERITVAAGLQGWREAIKNGWSGPRSRAPVTFLGDHLMWATKFGIGKRNTIEPRRNAIRYDLAIS